MCIAVREVYRGSEDAELKNLIVEGATILQDIDNRSTFGDTKGGRLTSSDYQRLANSSCTIFLTAWDRSYVPQEILRNWIAQYKMILDEHGVWILLTDNPECKLLGEVSE